MLIKLKNLRALRQAEFALGDITIICGSNNTGKTYATHATYGFLDFLRSNAEFPISNEIINQLFNEGIVTIPLNGYRTDLPKHINNIAKQYSKSLSKVFAGNDKLFENSEFLCSLGKVDLSSFAETMIKYGSAEKSVLQIKSVENCNCLEVSLIVDKSSDDVPPSQIIKSMISDGICNAIFSNIIPKPFLASAERTGAAIFQKELDFTRNRIIEMIGDKSTKLQPIQFLNKFSGEYPIAVRRNVDFIREIPNITHRESVILKEHPDILESFKDIIGGEYKVSKDGEVQYYPSNKSIKLALSESSSAVRSLLDVGFYLRHIAKYDDILMIDEPELNLHPENQRKLARLFAKLVNIGIKVFITTHSDYIIKELNTLIMLNKNNKWFKDFAKKEGYSENEILNFDKIRVYIAEEALIQIDGLAKKSRSQTLVPAKIDPNFGIQALSFDKTINDMNRIQEEIIWSAEYE